MTHRGKLPLAYQNSCIAQAKGAVFDQFCQPPQQRAVSVPALSEQTVFCVPPPMTRGGKQSSMSFNTVKLEQSRLSHALSHQ